MNLYNRIQDQVTICKVIIEMIYTSDKDQTGNSEILLFFEACMKRHCAVERIKHGQDHWVLATQKEPKKIHVKQADWNLHSHSCAIFHEFS